MSITRSIVLALTLAPVAGAAQTAPAVTVRVPDLSWIGPVVAGATARAAAAMDRAAPALAHAGAGMSMVSPALAQARAGMAQSQAALAGLDFRLQGLQGLQGLQSLQGLQGLQGLQSLHGLRDLRGLRMSGFEFDFDMDDDYDVSAPPAWAPQDPADALYKDARSALNRGRFSEAAGLFENVYTKYPKSAYAGDAYYYQAYALRRRGGEASLRKALDVLAQQKQKAPNASTRDDADELVTRIRGDLARGGDESSAAVIVGIAGSATAAAPATPSTPAAPVIAGTRSGRQGRPSRCDNDDDTQAAALNALLSMDGDRAIPILKKVLARRDEGSVCLRRKAVFMVSQHETPETEEILLSAARSDPDSEVREQAVWWLSQVDSPKAVAALDSILRSSADPVLQDKAIFALSQQDAPKARQALRDFALRASVSEDLREKAIFWIGQGDDPDRLSFLKTLYTQLKSHSARDKILFSVSQIEGRESERWLMQIAGDVNDDIELRKKALFWVGQSDAPGVDLYNLYEKMPSKEMKDQLIFVYSQRDEKAAVDKLLSIARTETDRELRKKAIFWLSQSDDPRVPDFIGSLLEKPQD